MSQNTANLLYLIPMACFILALRFLSSPRHARLGNQIGAAGMAVAIVVTLLRDDVVTGWWIMAVGGAIGAVIGVVGARKVKMTAMPQMVALFNGVGGGAAALVSLVEFHTVWAIARRRRRRARDRDGALRADRLDLVRRLDGRVREAAGARLGPADHVPGPADRQRAHLRRRGRARASGRWRRSSFWGLAAMILVAALFGVLFVLPIGGADMPVVISLLNAFTGLAAAATGFVLHSNVLIVSGMLVGASGTLLTMMMGSAMNRSIANVLFGAFGKVAAGPAGAPAGADGAYRALDDRGRRRRHARVREARRRRSRLRPRGRAGAARGAPARGAARGEGRRREVRDPSRRRPHAGAHERPARGSERARTTS